MYRITLDSHLQYEVPEEDSDVVHDITSFVLGLDEGTVFELSLDGAPQTLRMERRQHQHFSGKEIDWIKVIKDALVGLKKNRDEKRAWDSRRAKDQGLRTYFVPDSKRTREVIVGNQ